MRTFDEARGCMFDSSESREIVSPLACDALHAIDSNPEFDRCTRLSIASGASIHMIGKVDGA